MRYAIPFAIVATLIVVAGPNPALRTEAAAAEQQLLKNPSFEEVTEDNQPADWLFMWGDCVLDSVIHPDVDPPPETYPDGKHVARAYATAWGMVFSPAGWFQAAHVVRGRKYRLTGYIWTSTKTRVVQGGRQPMARIGVDLDGASDSIAAVDVWCATPRATDDNIHGWLQSEQTWTRVEAEFVAKSDYVTVYIDSETYSTLPWMAVDFDNVELWGEPPSESPRATPTFAPTATPTPTPAISSNTIPTSWVHFENSDSWRPRKDFAAVVFNNRVWIFGGNTQGALSDIWSSEDGLNWRLEMDRAPWGGRMEHQALVYRDRIWILGGRTPSGYQNDVWSSPDGVNWVQVDKEAPWSPRSNHGAAVLGDRLFLAGGTKGDGHELNDVWATRDGKEWECVRQSAPWFPRSEFGFASNQGKLWVVGGSYSGDVWNSTDGKTWNLLTHTANWPGRHGHALLSYDGLLWMFCGEGFHPGTLGDNWVSTDGLKWQALPSLPNREERIGHEAVVLHGKILILGGNKGRNLYSDVWMGE